MTPVESILFTKLTQDKSLPHPTARNFTPAEWVSAGKAITNPQDRDLRLLLAAIYYGNEIAQLRERFESSLFTDLDRRSSTLLSIACANYNFDVLAAKSYKVVKQKQKDFLHIGHPGRANVEIGYPENYSSPDAAMATLVDSLPHCLERANRRPVVCAIAGPNYWKLASELFLSMSAEHSLRNLWQTVLWDDWELVRDNDGHRHHQPVNRRLATLWHAWIWRHEMVLSQGTNIDAVTEKALALRGKDPSPFLSPTVTGIGGKSQNSRRFHIGQVSGRTLGQSWHRSEAQILEDSYLAAFLDAPLPGLENKLTCRDLQMMWCVIRDCTTILASRCKDRKFERLEDVEARALMVPREEVARAVAQCTGINLDRVSSAIKFFTCDHLNLTNLFTYGFWSSPFLQIDDGLNLAIVRAAVQVGSAIRRVEGWLNRAGLSDHLSDARRGLTYEANVRKEMSDALARNLLLDNSRCTTNSISGDKGEQIDLLVVLGSLLIVGEIKCFLYPIEPIEHFNYLKRLEAAGVQAVRKADWLGQNPQIVADALQISRISAASLRTVAVVVTNQGAGFGLQLGGARIIDAHFLKIYLSGNEYVSGMTFDAESGIVIRHPQTLYRDEVDAAVKFEATMAEPPPLQRLLRSAQWRDIHFPSSDGDDLLIAICHPDDSMRTQARQLAASSGIVP
jgi:hypothetical protein